MTKQEKLQLFEERKVRTLWDDEQEKWYISVIDTIEILTDSNEPKRYWSDLKRKLKKEGNETYENIVRLKMRATDGKMRMTDVADTEQLFRLIQSIPSGRVGTPADIARMCEFLCREENDFINGENITLDGGMTKKMIYLE